MKIEMIFFFSFFKDSNDFSYWKPSNYPLQKAGAVKMTVGNTMKKFQHRNSIERFNTSQSSHEFYWQNPPTR